MKKRKASKDTLVERFDAGEDVSNDFQFEQGVKTINLDLPVWAIRALDVEADRRGVARQALIKMWIVDRLDILAVARDLRQGKKAG